MSNKIASIEKIISVEPHPNADKLEVVKILGWQVCVRKGEFKAGDACVYIAIDSVLDERPAFEFLRGKQFKIKTMKLRGQVSQGICFPLSMFQMELAHDRTDANLPWPVSIGDEVSEFIGAKHYEKPLPKEMGGSVKGNLPSFIPRTDETNIKGCPEALLEFNGNPYYITQKLDGQSITFYLRNGEFGVCSRNLDLLDPEPNGFWNLAKKYEVEAKMRSTGMNNFAIQGEFYGPNLGHTGQHLAVFNLFDIETQSYASFETLNSFSKSTGLPLVPLVAEGDSFNLSLDQIKDLANAQLYNNSVPGEGIVVRLKTPKYVRALSGSSSFKAINENYED